jgi:hypothetical protein
VRIVELLIAGVFALAGIRSLWSWARRPFEGTDVVDHLLYALFVTGRCGLWFAFGGFFLIYASVDVSGRAALDELERYAWFVLVPLGLASVQLLAGVLLGNRSD